MPPARRWSTHPRRYALATTGPIPPDRRSDAPHPVAITAECDLVRSASTSTDCQSFAVREFLLLEDGNRVPLREGLEFTIGLPFSDVHEALSADALLCAMRGVVLPELSAIDREHPWDCLVRLARRRRVQTCADEIAQLPYELVLSEAVKNWL